MAYYPKIVLTYINITLVQIDVPDLDSKQGIHGTLIFLWFDVYKGVVMLNLLEMPQASINNLFRVGGGGKQRRPV